MKKRIGRKGALDSMALTVVNVIVIMFVGLFLISKVSTLTAINNTSSFYNIYTTLATSTGTLYDVVILVSFIFAIAIAIGMLKGIGGGGAPSVAV